MHNVRDKFNKSIPVELIDSIRCIGQIPITYRNIESFAYKRVLSEKFSKLKYLFDFEEESKELLEKLTSLILNLDLDGLINLCDTYEYRFFNVFDYLVDSKFINSVNQNDIFKLFNNVLIKCSSVNGVNIAIFVLSMFGTSEVYDLCRYVLKNDLNFFEINSFVLRYEKNIEVSNYINILSNFYNDSDEQKLCSILDDVTKYNFSQLTMIFYLYKEELTSFDNSDNHVVVLIINYFYYLKKILTRKLNSIYKVDSFFIDMYRDFSSLLKEIRISNCLNNLLEIDFLYKAVCIFEDKELFKKINCEEFLVNEFILRIFKIREIKNLRKIIHIFNVIDYDISNRLYEIFKIHYCDATMCAIVIRSIRSYKYSYKIFEIIEDTFYLTGLIRSDFFLLSFFRSLVLVYEDINFNVCLKVIKIIMDYEDIYFKYNKYLNYLTIKIIERS